MNRRDCAFLLCNCLSLGKEGAGTEHLRRQLASGNVSWDLLVELSSQHLLCPTLHWALDRKQLLACIPRDLRQYLRGMYDLNAERNDRLTAITVEAARHFNDAGVEPLLLKGAANLLSGLYADHGMRFIGDIDMLVPMDKIPACVERLRSAGYKSLIESHSHSIRRDHQHPAVLLKNGEYIRIEIHSKLARRRYKALVDTGAVLAAARPLERDGTRMLIPAPDHRVLHNVIHAQLLHDNYRMGQVSFRQLYDLVLLADGCPGERDWLNIAAQFERNRHMSALVGYLLAAELFFGYPLPPQINIPAGARCYLDWVRAQMSHLWVLQLGSTARVAVKICRGLQTLAAERRIPQIWTGSWYRRQTDWISDLARERW